MHLLVAIVVTVVVAATAACASDEPITEATAAVAVSQRSTPEPPHAAASAEAAVLAAVAGTPPLDVEALGRCRPDVIVESSPIEAWLTAFDAWALVTSFTPPPVAGTDDLDYVQLRLDEAAPLVGAGDPPATVRMQGFTARRLQAATDAGWPLLIGLPAEDGTLPEVFAAGPGGTVAPIGLCMDNRAPGLRKVLAEIAAHPDVDAATPAGALLAVTEHPQGPPVTALREAVAPPERPPPPAWTDLPPSERVAFSGAAPHEVLESFLHGFVFVPSPPWAQHENDLLLCLRSSIGRGACTRLNAAPPGEWMMMDVYVDPNHPIVTGHLLPSAQRGRPDAPIQFTATLETTTEAGRQVHYLVLDIAPDIDSVAALKRRATGPGDTFRPVPHAPLPPHF